MKEKDIPLKNYIILAIILIISVVTVVYFYMWYGAYEKNRLNTPIMDKYFTVINYNELDNYLVENKEAVIYVSVLGDENIRVFEKRFNKIIDDYSFNDSILYLDLTSVSKNDSLNYDLKNKYNLNDIPSIIIFKNGGVDDIYNIKANAYDIDNLIVYLTVEGVIND